VQGLTLKPLLKLLGLANGENAVYLRAYLTLVNSLCLSPPTFSSLTTKVFNLYPFGYTPDDLSV